jgi:hypothetical protein
VEDDKLIQGTQRAKRILQRSRGTDYAGWLADSPSASPQGQQLGVGSEDLAQRFLSVEGPSFSTEAATTPS